MSFPNLPRKESLEWTKKIAELQSSFPIETKRKQHGFLFKYLMEMKCESDRLADEVDRAINPKKRTVEALFYQQMKKNSPEMKKLDELRKNWALSHKKSK